MKGGQRTTQASRLLRMRQERVEAARTALADADADLRAIQARIGEALRAMAEHNAAARDALVRRAPQSVLGVYQRCVDDLQAVVTVHRSRLGEAEQRVQSRRRALRAALGELEAARRFRDRRRRQSDLLARRAETRESDDLHAARQAVRRRHGS